MTTAPRHRIEVTSVPSPTPDRYAVQGNPAAAERWGKLKPADRKRFAREFMASDDYGADLLDALLSATQGGPLQLARVVAFARYFRTTVDAALMHRVSLGEHGHARLMSEPEACSLASCDPATAETD